MFDADEMVMGFTRPDQFVQLGLDCSSVAVLRVLDEEHHQESDDGRAGVDDQLPCIGKAEDRTADGPHRDHKAAEDESGGRAGGMGHTVGGSCEQSFEQMAGQ